MNIHRIDKSFLLKPSLVLGIAEVFEVEICWYATFKKCYNFHFMKLSLGEQPPHLTISQPKYYEGMILKSKKKICFPLKVGTFTTVVMLVMTHSKKWLIYLPWFTLSVKNSHLIMVRQESTNQAVYKSDNLQYNTLVCWFAGTNDSSIKRLKFQALFFL